MTTAADYAKNRDEIRRKSREYYANNKDAQIKARLRWRARGEENRARDRESAKRYHRRLRDIVLEHYGNSCTCCQEARREFLAVDHVNGGGTKMRKVHGQAAQFLKWIIDRDFPSDFRLLCHNCNHARGAYGYCPHERELESDA